MNKIIAKNDNGEFSEDSMILVELFDNGQFDQERDKALVKYWKITNQIFAIL